MEKKQFDLIIVGAGISALSLAHFVNKFQPGLDILLLEKSDRLGGAIRSSNKNGFIFEQGPHGILDNGEESMELLNDLKFGNEILRAPLKQFKRYICLRGKLHELPQSPLKILKSQVMPFSGKLRVLGELIKRPVTSEQTIAEWATHRFGKSILPIADIAVTGTFAGDIEKLSIDSVQPGLRRIELESGSIIKGMIKNRKQPAHKKMPTMVSFRRGMEELVKKLSKNVDIQYDTEVDGIKKTDAGWRVSTSTGEYQCKQVALSIHINDALKILNELNPAPKKSIPVSHIMNIGLGFGSDAKIPFGFGFLAPKTEKRFALGSLFPTHMFKNRAPKGIMTLEVLVGGIRNPENLTLEEDELKAKALEDMRQLIELPSDPIYTNIVKSTTGLPQLELGHHKLQAYRDEMIKRYPGVFIHGCGWEGIGVNEMIKDARQTAQHIVKGDKETIQPKAKGIYF